MTNTHRGLVLAQGQGAGLDTRRPLTGKSQLAYGVFVGGDVFKALADPTRRLILDELADRDRQTLFELCGRLATKHGISSTRQAISQHLDILQAAGLVRAERSGRYKFHHLDTAPLRQLTDRWPVRPASHPTPEITQE